MELLQVSPPAGLLIDLVLPLLLGLRPLGLLAPVQLLLGLEFVLDCLANEGIGGGPLDVLAVEAAEVGLLHHLQLHGRHLPAVLHDAFFFYFPTVGQAVVLLAAGIEVLLALGHLT